MQPQPPIIVAVRFPQSLFKLKPALVNDDVSRMNADQLTRCQVSWTTKEPIMNQAIQGIPYWKPRGRFASFSYTKGEQDQHADRNKKILNILYFIRIIQIINEGQ
jgi:hypothetical protein